MPGYLLAPEARADLEEIIDQIAEERPNAARRVLAKFRSAMERLAEHPGLGHTREDLADESLSFWAVHTYLVIYRPGTQPLQIARILHGARDVRSILARDEPS